MRVRDFTLVDLPAVLQRESSVIEPGGLEGASGNGTEGGLFNVLVSEIAETLCWNFHLQFGCVSLYYLEAGARGTVNCSELVLTR